MTAQNSRIEGCFAKLKEEGRAALVTFVTAGDPDYDTSLNIINELAKSGSDLIEVGMPFSDPMADGPAIQHASERALDGGQTMIKTLEIVRKLRAKNDTTPIILMGYYNPIYIYGAEAFLKDAKAAGVDGLIVVDLPPEADDELCIPAKSHNIHFIRLITPTTDDKRLPTVLENASGFLYYVSIAGVTGTAAPDLAKVRANIERVKQQTDLPVAIGFGVNQPSQVAQFAQFADGVVVGSAIVRYIEAFKAQGEQSASNKLIGDIGTFVGSLAEATRRK